MLAITRLRFMRTWRMTHVTRWASWKLALCSRIGSKQVKQFRPLEETSPVLLQAPRFAASTE
jgi:hypothetical protein